METWRVALADAREAEGEHGRQDEALARYIAGNAIYIWQQYTMRYREHDRRRRAIEGQP